MTALIDNESRRRVASLITGFWPAQAINAAIRIGVPERLAQAPATAGGLAAATHAHPGSMYRLLRALVSIGIVDEGEGGVFTLTADGRSLLPDAPNSLRGMALHVGNQLWPAFGELERCVREGAPPPGIKHGPDGFAELNDKPDEAAIFNQSMVDGSRKVAGQAIAAFDFSRFSTVMDVGGGYGGVLAALLAANPALKGMILDLPHGEAGARAYLAGEGVADRADYVTASFFDPIPPIADCYVLKYIIHDWNDDYARRIMARVGAAARESNGTVVLIERVVPERIENDPAHRGIMQGDLTMMLWDGKERTAADYRLLFEGAGLALSRIIDIGDGFSLIEGVVAGQA